MQHHSYAVKDTQGSVHAIVTCPTARQAFWNAVLVVRQLHGAMASPSTPLYYAEPVTLH